MAMEGERDFGEQDVEQALGMAGAFLKHEGRRARIDADQAQDRGPCHELPAEAAEMAGGEIGIAAAGHSP